MLDNAQLARIHELLAEFDLDGWLIFDFRGQNRVAAAVLGPEIVGTRRVYVLVPRIGVPTALVHAIDNDLWRHWPAEWIKHIWVRREELEAHVVGLLGGKRLAAEYSPRNVIPYLDTLPAGVYEFLSGLGVHLVSSVDLVTRFCSVWTPRDLASHQRAAKTIARIAGKGIALAGDRARTAHPMTEYDLAEWIREQFKNEGLIADNGPSVSFGPNSARNHYEPTPDEAEKIIPGEMLLVDLWAKEPSGVYADQTWMASIGAPKDRDTRIWETLRSARDAALALITQRIRSGRAISGAEADAAARTQIELGGFRGSIQARTGHSIDRFGLHGFGPPIDDTETYDDRLLIPGVGFSVEPGIYLPGQTGARSEVNVHIGPTDALITPENYQRDLIVV